MSLVPTSPSTEGIPLAPAPRGARSLHATAAPGHAHAKVILLGEHAVVHGLPALALPVHALSAHADAFSDTARSLDSDLYTGAMEAAPGALAPIVAAVDEAQRRRGVPGGGVRVRLRSTIPPGRGLGSSAAVASAVAQAVTALYGAPADEELRYELTQHAERLAHGTPSGLDARAVGAAGPIWFRAGTSRPAAVSGRWGFVIADTGVGKATRETVRRVYERRAARPVHTDGLLQQLGEFSRAGRDDLAAGRYRELGSRMDAAHAVLAELGVSGPELDKLVEAARAARAVGAKLTGGGHGGCILALAEDVDACDDLAAALRAAGARQTWVTVVEDAPVQKAPVQKAPVQNAPLEGFPVQKSASQKETE